MINCCVKKKGISKWEAGKHRKSLLLPQLQSGLVYHCGSKACIGKTSVAGMRRNMEYRHCCTACNLGFE